MYKTVADTGEFEQAINKSTFIAHAYHVESEDEVQAIIQAERKKHPDARHCCWAYVIGEKKDSMRYSDDGEPQGTAGQPMLSVLEKKDITNTLVTVIRYFGGILLGAGGLTRAYSSSAAGAVDATGIKTMILSVRTRVYLDYTTHSRLQKAIEKMPYVITENVEYLERVCLYLTVKEEDLDTLCDFFIQSTAAKAEPEVIEKLFLPW